MPQTTAATAGVECDVEISTNGSTWLNLSGSITMVEVPEQERMTGVGYVFEGDVGTVTSGKRVPVEVRVTGLYTEESGEAYESIRTHFQAPGGTRIYFRYSPLGIGEAGRKVFTASNDGTTAGAVVVNKLKLPDPNAGAADPLPFFWTMLVPAFVETDTGSSTGLGS